MGRIVVSNGTKGRKLMRCDTCGCLLHGVGNCIICDKQFLKTTKRQILCPAEACKQKRISQIRRKWQVKNNHMFIGAGRFPGCYIKCVVCEKEVQQTHILQRCCGSQECRKKQNHSKFRTFPQEIVHKQLVAE